MVYLSYGHATCANSSWKCHFSTFALHNRLMISSAKNIYRPTGLRVTEDINRELTLGLWKNNNCADSMFSLEKPISGLNASITAKEIRDTYPVYFMNEGAVQWLSGKC